MTSALERLEDGEICRIFIGGDQFEASWWPEANAWVYHTPTVTRAISHATVEEWVPVWVQY